MFALISHVLHIHRSV